MTTQKALGVFESRMRSTQKAMRRSAGEISYFRVREPKPGDGYRIESVNVFNETIQVLSFHVYASDAWVKALELARCHRVTAFLFLPDGEYSFIPKVTEKS